MKKFGAVALKFEKYDRGLLFIAAPCIYQSCHKIKTGVPHFWNTL